MRRHWCLTLWLDSEGNRFGPTDENRDGGVIPLDSWLDQLHELAATLEARYYCWSLEAGSSADPATEAAEGLHLHAYIESDRSIRWSTVVRRSQLSFHGAHVEPRSGWRDTAREYHKGLRRGELKEDAITMGEWGEWLEVGDGSDMKADDIAAEAARMIVEGQHPRAVAMRFPKWFLSRGHGVWKLHETIGAWKA